MSSVTREIHIEADPAVVRRLVTDADGRGTWLDLPVTEPTDRPGGGVRFERREPGRPPSHVDIEVSPDGAGTRVRVTEHLAAPARQQPQRSRPPLRVTDDPAAPAPAVEPDDGPVALVLLPSPTDGGRTFAPPLVPPHDRGSGGPEGQPAAPAPWCLAAAA